MPKLPGESVRLRVVEGDVPRPGSVLCLASGRRYWVTRVGGKTLHCRVMAPSDPVPEHAVAVLDWHWVGSRKPRRGKPLAQLIWEAA